MQNVFAVFAMLDETSCERRQRKKRSVATNFQLRRNVVGCIPLYTAHYTLLKCIKWYTKLDIHSEVSVVRPNNK